MRTLRELHHVGVDDSEAVRPDLVEQLLGRAAAQLDARARRLRPLEDHVLHLLHVDPVAPPRAPRSPLLSMARRSAAPSTTSARAVFTTIARGRSRAIAASPSSPRVSAESATCSVTASARPHSSGTVAVRSTPSAFAPASS